MIPYNPWHHLLWTDVWHLFVWFFVLLALLPWAIDWLIERVTGKSTNEIIKNLRGTL